jgi:hypothetical protein
MRNLSPFGMLTAAALLTLAPAALAQAPNPKPAAVLRNFDIDGNGVADASADSDSDGLPDTWEAGGVDPTGTEVPFPGPQANIPGTPPVSLFSRRPVRTSATLADTDGDGLTDFIEVFGLMFIDDNRNGVLDTSEWFDANGDGMPSIGEFPLVNDLVPGRIDDFDFDGFVFTDPTNPDTDGDGSLDGADNDPLVNPRSFGQDCDFFPTGTECNSNSDRDRDNDGLGNGMDLGSDSRQLIDNPSQLLSVLEIFRPDLLGGADIRVPEALLEDLLGADWNGDGLFRLTDILSPHFGVTAPLSRFVEGVDVFDVGGVKLFATTVFPAEFRPNTYFRSPARSFGVPLAYQEYLLPAGRGDNIFLPDPRIWTVLYSWRVPGFDVDGNGFIGYDSESFSGILELNGASLDDAARTNLANDPSTNLPIAAELGGNAGSDNTGGLDGRVDGTLCGFPGLTAFSIVVSIVGLGWSTRRRAVGPRRRSL